MLGFPQTARARVIDKSLRIARTVSPDGWHGPFATDERIVRGNAAVVVQAVDLARHAGEALREIVGIGRSAAIADGKKEVAASVESHPAAKVRTGAGRLIGRRIEDHFQIGETVILQLAPRDRGEGAFADRLRVSEVDPTVLRVIGMQHDIKKSSLTACNDWWNTGDFAWCGSRFIDEQKSSAAFGDKKPSIG